SRTAGDLELNECRRSLDRRYSLEGPMATFMKALLALNLLIAASYLVTSLHAQRPPELDATGAAYLRVNTNPTDIPPMVNINPYETVPKIEITRLPEIQMPASGCHSGQLLETGLGRPTPVPR